MGVLLIGTLVILPGYAQTESGSVNEVPSKEQLSDRIRIFPNPSDGVFHLELLYSGPEEITAKVFDITGKMIRDISDQLLSGDSKVTADVDLESPGSGIYLLRIGIGKSSFTHKIIIR